MSDDVMASSQSPQPARESGASERSVLARYEGPIRITALVAMIAGLFLIARTLPIAAGVAWLEGWIEGLGVWGPVAFGLIYVVAAVAFVPGGALTILGGLLFGVGVGLVTVSLASTTGAALAFLIGRYLARDAVREQTRRYPRFGAIDRAIGEGGWRIVLMLRLVPMFPFNVGNYLLGLTPVRFWPYVLASWIGMLPGTFVYVYLGHLGRVGAEAAARGEGAGRDPLEWVLLIVGGLVAVGVVVYMTRLVRRKLAEQTEIAADEGEDATGAAPPQRRSGTGRTAAMAVVGALVLLVGVVATVAGDRIAAMFRPPAVEMVESYEHRPDGPVFDHAEFEAILQSYVHESGGVDYAGLAADPEPLLAYNASLAEAPFDEMGRNEKLALLINAYNSFTLQLIVEYLDEGIESIRDIPGDRRWDDARWNVAGHVWSLNEIEHEQIRPHFIEPDIHWALVCAAVDCPPLRREAYTGDRVEQQLREQAEVVHTDGTRWLRYDRERGVIHLTRLYDWYASDYEQVAGTVLDYVARYNVELAEDLEAGREPRVRYLEYDWRLNDQENLP